MPDRIIRYKEAGQLLSVSPKTVRYWVSIGAFPAPIKLGARVAGWRESDFEQALADKKKESSNR